MKTPKTIVLIVVFALFCLFTACVQAPVLTPTLTSIPTGTPAPTHTSTATLTSTLPPTFTPTLTVVPPTATIAPTSTPIPTATPISVEASPNMGDIDYDGLYQGMTSQERTLQLTIENGGVVAIFVDFEIETCDTYHYSPMSVSFGKAVGTTEDGVINLDESGIVLTGTFTSPTEISGTMEINPFLCDEKVSVTWNVSSDVAVTDSALSPELVALLPDLEIPEELFLPEAGVDNISEYHGILGIQGDWILIQDFYSILPAPAGWTTDVGGGGSSLVFSETGDPTRLSIMLRVGVFGTIGDKRTINSVIAEVMEGLSQNPATTKAPVENVMDANKGYIVTAYRTEDGNEYMLLMIFSKDIQGFFNFFWVDVAPEDWPAYSPIIQAMLAHWVDWDLRPLGLVLPDDLGQ